MEKAEKVEALRRIVVESALWGWNAHRQGATEEQVERIASKVALERMERAEPEGDGS